MSASGYAWIVLLVLLVVTLVASALYVRHLRATTIATVTPDQIDHEYTGTSLSPVAKMTKRELLERKKRHDEFQWKWVDVSGSSTRLILLAADGKLGLVEIVTSSERSNGVPVELQNPALVSAMDVATAGGLIRSAHAPEWLVTGGDTVDVLPNHPDLSYIVLRRGDSGDHKLVLFRPVIVTENRAFADVS